MTRTLAELRQQINELIQQQGENASVAAWIFTKEDVLEFPDENVTVTEELATKVIDSLDAYDHIYTEIFDIIDDELHDAKVL
jgi:transcriptional/translational regulatory protein YebC/TACO1